METNASAAKLILTKASESGRCVAIAVVNKSSKKLERKRFYCDSGRVKKPGGESIGPGDTDYTLFIKKDFIPCGSVGDLTFDFKSKRRRRLAILFSNPFNYILYHQTFAVHITNNLEATPQKLFNDMYYHGDRLQHYTRGEENGIQMPHMLTRDGIKVTASMTAEYKSILTVVVEDECKS